MNDTPAMPQKPMLLIAVVQGLALMFLYNATESGAWPSQSPLWSYPLWTLAFAVPVLLLLSFERGNEWGVTKLTVCFAVVLALAGLYIGSQARPFGEFPLFSLTCFFTATMTLASFKALMYLQQRASGLPMTYDVLFTHSWRNFLTLALALLFTFVFWLILMLWGSLFNVIGIDFFEELFRMDWFRFPVLGLVFGVGIVVFRNLTRVIDSIARLLQGLIKLLLPLVLLIAVVFVVSLPFVGPDALWSTGRGTALLLWLLALILFFVNAVYQDGRGDGPYPTAIHRTLYAALLITPFISALSLYGLVLRIQQYGLSVERCWAFVVWFVLTLFALGYVVGIVRKRDQWTLDLARVNSAMGLVVLAILLLANSPALDFRKLSVSSQLARVEANKIELGDFDFWYAHRTLARPGYLAMEDMKRQVADSDPELLARIENPKPPAFRGQRPGTGWWGRILYRPARFEVPETLRQLMEKQNFVPDPQDPVLIRTDLDEDGQSEYVLIVLFGQRASTARIYYRQASGWRFAPVYPTRPPAFNGRIADAVKTGEITLESPRFKHLKIGDVIFSTYPASRVPALAAAPLTGAD